MIACFNSLRFGGDGWRGRGLGVGRLGFMRHRGQREEKNAYCEN